MQNKQVRQTARAPKERRNLRMNVPLDDAEHTLLMDAAKREDRSVSSFMRYYAVRVALARRDKVATHG